MFNYDPKPNSLAGKTVLITGGAKGIGKAIAMSYAEAGAQVIITGRDASTLIETCAEINQAYPSDTEIATAEYVVLDLLNSDDETCENVATACKTRYQKLDGLVHNAGILGDIGPIGDADTATWLDVMQINLNGAFVLTKALLPLLSQSPSASIIFTSSSVGRKGRATWGAYSVSKFATEGLMQTLADELSHEKSCDKSNIRCNSVNPGATATAMRQKAYPDEDPSTIATPCEIMPAYLFLMGPDSEGINSQALNAQNGSPADFY